MTNQDTAVALPRTLAPARQRHAEAIEDSDHRLAEALPEVTENALELALGRKQEQCPYHHMTLRCPHISKFKDAGEWSDDDTPEGRPCEYESRGYPTNERMIRYVMDRIAGTPTISGDKQISMDFVRRVGRHVADAFAAVNDIQDRDERAREFASAIAQMWMLIGES